MKWKEWKNWYRRSDKRKKTSSCSILGLNHNILIMNRQICIEWSILHNLLLLIWLLPYLKCFRQITDGVSAPAFAFHRDSFFCFHSPYYSFNSKCQVFSLSFRLLHLGKFHAHIRFPFIPTISISTASELEIGWSSIKTKFGAENCSSDERLSIIIYNRLVECKCLNEIAAFRCKRMRQMICSSRQ